MALVVLVIGVSIFMRPCKRCTGSKEGFSEVTGRLVNLDRPKWSPDREEPTAFRPVAKDLRSYNGGDQYALCKFNCSKQQWAASNTPGAAPKAFNTLQCYYDCSDKYSKAVGSCPQGKVAPLKTHQEQCKTICSASGNASDVCVKDCTCALDVKEYCQTECMFSKDGNCVSECRIVWDQACNNPDGWSIPFKS